jgi:aspartate/tyrosine/aromatic aminotransferase
MGKSAGYEVRTYRYYDAATKGIDWKGMIEDLNVKLFFITNCFLF